VDKIKTEAVDTKMRSEQETTGKYEECINKQPQRKSKVN